VVAIERTGQIVRTMIETMGQIFSGGRSVKELGGPLKIAQVSGQAATLGIESFIFFVALISINLGFINLLPIPMLDGGHLLFYGIEAVQRRPVSAQAQEWAYRSGLAVLMAMMLLVTFNDLSSFGLWKSLSGLIG
jgi:regulator of sigma E protease